MVGPTVSSSVVITDHSDAFFDTSVLYKHTLDQDNGSAEEALSNQSCESVVSKFVKREYDGVQKRRKKLVRSIREAIAKDSFDSWSMPDSSEYSPHDRDWCEELVEELRDISTDDDIVDRLETEKKKFKTGKRILFRGSDALISDVVNYGRSPSLSGQLQIVMNHTDDRKIICDAAAWSANGGTGNFVTSDCNHMLSNREAIMEKVNRDRSSESIEMASPTEFLSTFPS
jgi:hypothetical protein